MQDNYPGMNGHSRLSAGDSLRENGAGQESDGLQETPFVPATGPRLVSFPEQSSIGAERFRMLAGRLQYFQKQRRLKKVAITSAVPGEGKSLVAANLAFSLARTQRTLLIDGDLHQSGLKKLLGTHGVRGLTEWWETGGSISDFLLHVDAISLWYLPSGQAKGQPLEILQSHRMAEALGELSESFEWIIIDSPPLVAVADGHIWATHADGTLLVVRQGMTPKKLLQSALENAASLKLLGSVMNAAQESRQQHYYSSYYGNPRLDRSTRDLTVSKPAKQMHGSNPSR
jgi:capsular exopolysaccharide synthesis family protein